ncbi:translation initiation factor IF-2 subunit alpha [Candidatus Woesearchaeota archaeon]|nr:translation initiation factor IF-2 subunit alpha [Candidatus Woesearchaeota archaeon]
MLLKRKGFPEDDELLFCTVTSVQSHSVFVKLEEYGLSGMIHISEVAPGRIRNIRDFVVENKPIVCKVIGVNKERGHIDLSLRRVTEGQRRAKINEVKQEQKAEKIVELVAKQLGMPSEDLYVQISEKIVDKFSSVFEAFTAIAKGDVSDLGVSRNISEKLNEAVISRIKPPVVEVKGKLSLVSYDPDGVSVVRQALEQAAKSGVSVSYLGAGTYLLKLTAENYKSAEQSISKAASSALEFIESKGGEGSFARS